MSSGTVELDILNPFKKYLLATDCYSNRVDTLGANNCGKLLSKKFYQAKYYNNNDPVVHENDVPYQFVNSIVRLAQSIRSVDTPSTKGNILSALPGLVETFFHIHLQSAINSLFTNNQVYLNQNIIKVKDERPDFPKIVQNFTNVLHIKLTSMISNGLINNAGDNSEIMQAVTRSLEASFSEINAGRLTDKKVALGLISQRLKNDLERYYREKYALNYTFPAPYPKFHSPSTLSGAEKAKKILDAYKENKLSNTDKELFDLFFTIQKEEEEVVVEGESERVKVVRERINLKTIAGVDYNFSKLKIKHNQAQAHVGGVLPLKLHVITLSLPVLSSGTKFWFKSNSHLTSLTVGKDGVTETVLQDIFERAYLHGFAAQNDLPIDDCCNFSDLSNEINHKKYITDILCESKISINRDLTREDKYQEKNKSQLNELMLENTWKKVSDGVYQLRVPHGLTTITYETRDCDKYMEEINNKYPSNCGTTFVNIDDDEKCQKYIKAINNAAGSNPQELKEYLDNDNFDWDEDIKKLKLIYPEQAFRTLRAFGFKTVSQYDVFADQYLTKVCGVELWLEKYVSEKINDAKTLKKINDNDKLKYYLACIVHFINANPTLLNPGFKLASQEKENVTSHSQELTNRGIEQYKSNDYNVNDVWSWDKLWENNNVGEHPMKLEFCNDSLYTHGGLPADIMFNSFAGLRHGMIGGSVSTYVDNIQLGGNYSSVISNEMTMLLNDLESSHKFLDPESKFELKNKVNMFEKSEKELYEIAKTIQIYCKLLRIIGNNTNETVNLNVLKSYVDKHNGLLSKHRSTSSKFINLVKHLKSAMESANESNSL
jgi:hypothetical protein